MIKDCSSLVGHRFGRLVVTGLFGTDNGRNRIWVCRCDCGTEKNILGISLKSGTTKSCGCFRADRMGGLNKTHGQRRTSTYRIWAGMRTRCQNHKSPEYKDYGARGIKVCDKWQKFAGFYDDMGDRPPKYTIERIDFNGNYEKSNCKWATVTENLRNRRCVKLNMEKANEIRELCKNGATQNETGLKYNITQNWVSRIVRHINWKNE